jgi:hypothetical protein
VHDAMGFGSGVTKVVGFRFPERHRAFDSLGRGELRCFSFGELKKGLTEPASLRVTVAPAPVFDEVTRFLHGFVFDRVGLDLRKEVAAFLASCLTPPQEPGRFRHEAGLLGAVSQNQEPHSSWRRDIEDD